MSKFCFLICIFLTYFSYLPVCLIRLNILESGGFGASYYGRRHAEFYNSDLLMFIVTFGRFHY